MNDGLLPPSTLQYIGKTYNRLTVISFTKKIGHRKYFLCRCTCGKEIEVLIASVVSGNTKSCGCLAREMTKSRFTKHGHAKEKLYKVWAAMKDRCNNSNNKEYRNYGGRGISVCNEWYDYSVFRKWCINAGYKEALTIDRINVNGNYEPSNCRWVEMKEQSRNKRTNNVITYNGESMVITDWASRLGIDMKTLYHRIFEAGWTIEEALTMPKHRRPDRIINKQS